MPTEGTNLESLLERVVQMNMIIIEHMEEQSKQFQTSQLEMRAQQSQILEHLPLRSSTTTATTDSSIATSSHFNKINTKPKDYNGTSTENVLTWIITLDEILVTRSMNDDEKISLAEQLRQQLLKLRQKQSLPDYIHLFRSIVGQVTDMDELTQVMFFINGLSINTSLYVQSKHPQTVEDAIREATTYDNVMTIGKNSNRESVISTYVKIT
ncbi:unnamed protein product [Rotaria socialis]